MLRALWSGEPVAQKGLLAELKGARLAFQPPAPIPIYIAAMKEQMLKLSGRIAVGVVLSAGLSAGFVAHSLGLAAAGRVEAGRTSASFTNAGYVYFLATNSPKAGMQTMRARLAFLMRNRYIDDNLAHSKLPIDQAAIMAAIARRNFDEAARLVPEEAVEAFSITGTPEQARAGIERFQKAGLEEIVLLMAGEREDWEVGYEVIRSMA